MFLLAVCITVTLLLLASNAQEVLSLDIRTSLAEIDTNGDFEIDRDEFKFTNIMDKNGDGTLDLDEIYEALAALRDMIPKPFHGTLDDMILALDTDKDGELQDSEIFNYLDSNLDGKITTEDLLKRDGEAEEIVEVEQLANIETDNIVEEEEKEAEILRLTQIETSRIAEEEEAERLRLANIDADRIAEIDADRVAAAAAAATTAKEEEVERLRLAQIDTDRVAAAEAAAKEEEEKTKEAERLRTDAEKKAASVEKEAIVKEKIVAAPVKLQLSDEAIKMRAERERKVAADNELLEKQRVERAQKLKEQEESRRRQQQLHAARRDEDRRKQAELARKRRK